MFFNFLINFLHLEELDGPCYYYPWYDGPGAVLGAIIPFLCSLFFVILFYYVWSKFKATNTAHWCLMGFVNMIFTFVLNLFIGRASLANYVLDTLGEEYQDLWYNVVTWPFSTDIWFFAINGIVWALVFYFVLSLALKHWSSVWNVPFGKKYKKSIN